MTLKEIANNHPDKWILLKKKIFEIIHLYGVDSGKDIKYIKWDNHKIYLCIWCEKFIMSSTYDENFKTLSGLVDIKPTYEELINFLKTY